MKVRVNKAFKIATFKAVVALLSFLLFYALLLIGAFSLTGLCFYWAILLIGLHFSVLTVLLGIGLIGFGILIVVFLLKFIFKTYPIDNSHLTEITKEDEPELFQLIHEIVSEVGTKFPKKVFLSTKVNASVFYDSNFWSMFFPVRKNLEIGIALINTSTKNELKAILAHEFGHFSQRSTKIGSYVNNVNKMINNLVNDNDEFDKTMHDLSNLSGYFGIFVVIAFNLIRVIQWLLGKFYFLVNINYLKLSREMEFHADEVAASVAGKQAMSTALLRLEISENCLNQVFDFYDKHIHKNFVSSNLFQDQLTLIQHVAQEKNMRLEHQFPVFSLEDLQRNLNTKLEYEDKWSTHPTIEERVKRLLESNYNQQELNDFPANNLLKNGQNLHESFTNLLYRDVKFPGEIKVLSTHDFIELFKKENTTNSFSTTFNSYYDNHAPAIFDLTAPLTEPYDLNFNNLFSSEKVALIYEYNCLQNDVQSLHAIGEKSIHVSSFKYNGLLYKRKQSSELIDQLFHKIESLSKEIEHNDLRIFHYFKNIETSKNQDIKLKYLYQDFFTFSESFQVKMELYIHFQNNLQVLSSRKTNDEIFYHFDQLKPSEVTLKDEIRALLSDASLFENEAPKMKMRLEKYISNNWEYFGITMYYDDNLQLLSDSLAYFYHLLLKKNDALQREILGYQEHLLRINT